jgi:SagB-type dehydrogenase family enzyme
VSSQQSSISFLKAGAWNEWPQFQTDQQKGLPAPPPQKPYPAGATLIDLSSPDGLSIGQMSLIEVIKRRRSRRQFRLAPLSLEELSFLLWATQGVQQVIDQDAGKALRTLRTVPSGGARHPFETYVLVNNVTGLAHGLYRYLPMQHKLCLVSADPDIADKIHEASRHTFVRDSAVTFVWTAIPYRTEWRYGILSPKIIAQDSGHLCQNLYLACTAIGAGACAMGAYDQEKMDAALGVDGENEFTIYMAPVGRA